MLEGENVTFPETNSEFTPENQCLEDDMSFSDGQFLGGKPLASGNVRGAFFP